MTVNSKSKPTKKPKNAKIHDGPLLSVIVPIYNSEEYLRRCLESLVNQTFKDLEVIMVNDASTDGSQDIIDEYCSKFRHFVTVKHQHNKGLLLARKSGIKIATSKYITHLDSDDYVEPDCYQITMQRALETDADVTQFGMSTIRDGIKGTHGVSISKYPLLKGPEIFEKFCASKINFSVCNKIYKLEVWKESMPFFPKRSLMVEDLSQNLFILSSARTYASVPDKLYNYVTTSNSDSRTFDARSMAFRAYSAARHLANFKRHLPAQDQQVSDNLLKLQHTVYHNYVRPMVARMNSGVELPPEQAVLTQAVWKIYRLNGYFGLRPYIRYNTLGSAGIFGRSAHEPACGVSVVIPVFNTEMHLAKCLDSVLNQTYQNLEIVAVNDCSTDSSSFILNSYKAKHPNIRVITHEENKGLLQARLTGARAATGKYIAHIDSDDEYEPEFLHVLVNAAEDRNADIVSCGYNEIEEDGSTMAITKCKGEFDCDGDEAFLKFLEQDIYNAMWNKLHRRELWELALPHFLSMTYRAEDICQTMYLLYFCTRYHHVDRPLYNRLVRSENGDRKLDAETICERAVTACFNMANLRDIIKNVPRKQPSVGFNHRLLTDLNGDFQQIFHIGGVDRHLVDKTVVDCLEFISFDELVWWGIKPYVKKQIEIEATGSKSNAWRAGLPLADHTGGAATISVLGAFLRPNTRLGVSGLYGKTILGWAWDKSCPEKIVSVTTYVKDQPIQVTLANRLYDPFGRRTSGLEKHAFVIDLSGIDFAEGDQVRLVCRQGLNFFRSSTVQAVLTYKNGTFANLQRS